MACKRMKTCRHCRRGRRGRSAAAALPRPLATSSRARLPGSRAPGASMALGELVLLPMPPVRQRCAPLVSSRGQLWQCNGGSPLLINGIASMINADARRAVKTIPKPLIGCLCICSHLLQLSKVLGGGPRLVVGPRRLATAREDSRWERWCANG